MGKLENAYLVHTIVPNNNVTEETGESTLNAKTVTTKDDIKARRIIYLHISEEIWEKVDDIDIAFELFKCSLL